MIVVHGLELAAGGRVLLEPASFIAASGEFVAVLGANGTGKTTLLRTLAGARAYTSGSIYIGERSLSGMTHAQRAALIAHLTGDDLFLDRLAVRDVVAMGRYAHHHWWEWRRSERDGEAVLRALEAVRMHPFADRAFDTLSSGERQRVWIALALAQEAPVLLLDEPTSHLDVHAAQEILHLLRSLCREGKTVVCALHDLNEAAQMADKVLLIGSGRLLAFDSPQRVLSSRVMEQAYGIPLETVQTGNGSLRIFPAERPL